MTKAAEAIRAAATRLAKASDTARLDAELLMAHALGVSRSDLLLRHMDASTPDSFHALIDRRQGHEPVAHILGSQEFYGRDFAVDRNVLIPRADSETLIDAALGLIAPDARGRVLDLGTGSGALLLTLLCERPLLEGVGIDASEAALGLARSNAASLHVADRAHLRRADWREEGWADGLGRFEIVLCNPPYVESGAMLDPQVRDFEPHEALFAGPEGLDDYRAIMPQLGKLIVPDGVAIFEIGSSQGDAIATIAQDSGFSAEMRRDLANRTRAAIVR